MSGESTTTEDISLSVQATNELREKLGLKPLRDGPSAREQQIVEQRKVKEAVRQRPPAFTLARPTGIGQFHASDPGLSPG
eukprot:COSAG01_NODE_96_length_26789_cov_36.697089_6_plen_80_part_00